MVPGLPGVHRTHGRSMPEVRAAGIDRPGPTDTNEVIAMDKAVETIVQSVYTLGVTVGIVLLVLSIFSAVWLTITRRWRE